MHLILLTSEYLLRVELALEGDDEGDGVQPRPEIAHMVRMSQRMMQRASDLASVCGQKHCPHWNGRADNIRPHDDRCNDDSEDLEDCDDEPSAEEAITSTTSTNLDTPSADGSRATDNGMGLLWDDLDSY